MPRQTAPRFGIGEWFGRSFVNLTKDQRVAFARTAQTNPSNNPRCPFLSREGKPVRCWKKGGICSLRLYEELPDQSCVVVKNDAKQLRITCPSRFEQGGIIYSRIAEVMIGTAAPAVVTQVRFLRRHVAKQKVAADESDSVTKKTPEDVGNIDAILVNLDNTESLQWCAVEIQAVYFSGEGMDSLFQHIEAFDGAGIPFPDKTRRPDYRSSGPKRLMPQLQIKVPTLRRWGKKMALVVDRPWFQANVVGVESVSDIPSSDIAWFLVDFDERTDPATLIIGDVQLQTLEKAVEGLTGGSPVTLSEFESKIRAKISVAIV